MATARERLLQALTAIISQPFSEEGKVALTRLLNTYRVQAKPEEKLIKDQTAREGLLLKIIEIWKIQGSLEKKQLNSITRPFRMQLKQGLNRTKGTGYKPDRELEGDERTYRSSGITRAQLKEKIAQQENAYFKEKHQDRESKGNKSNVAIAGGPKKGANFRGLCPKCRSLGIVLARTYGGDDYHSCIYCGYQAYLKNKDLNLDLPIAAELLRASFSDPEADDD